MPLSEEEKKKRQQEKTKKKIDKGRLKYGETVNSSGSTPTHARWNGTGWNPSESDNNSDTKPVAAPVESADALESQNGTKVEQVSTPVAEKPVEALNKTENSDANIDTPNVPAAKPLDNTQQTPARPVVTTPESEGKSYEDMVKEQEQYDSEENTAANQQRLDNMQSAEAQEGVDNLVNGTKPSDAADTGASNDDTGLSPKTLSPLEQIYQESLNQYKADIEAERQRMIDLGEQSAKNEKLYRTRATIAALGDAFTTMANVWGTTKGAENQKQTYISPVITDSIERSRKEYTTRIKEVNDSLAKAKDRLLKLQTTGDNADLKRDELEFKKQKLANEQELKWASLQERVQSRELRERIQAFREGKFEFDSEMDKLQFEELVRTHKENEALRWMNANNTAERTRIYAESVSGQGKNKTEDGESYGAFLDKIARERFGAESWDDIDIKPGDPKYKEYQELNEAKSSKSKQAALKSSYNKESGKASDVASTDSKGSEKPKAADKPKSNSIDDKYNKGAKKTNGIDDKYNK